MIAFTFANKTEVLWCATTRRQQLPTTLHHCWLTDAPSLTAFTSIPICPCGRRLLMLRSIDHEFTTSMERSISTRWRGALSRYEGYVRFVDVYRQPLFRWWWLPWYTPDWTTVMVYWSAFRPTWCVNSSQSSMQLRDWYPSEIKRPYYRCAHQPSLVAGSRADPVGYKLAVMTYKVLHGRAPSYPGLGPLVRVADVPGRRALRSAGTNRILVPPVTSTTVGSRGRCPSNLEFSTRRRYLRWVAANLPDKAEKRSILSIVSWLLLLTFTPAVDLAVGVKNTLINWSIEKHSQGGDISHYWLWVFLALVRVDIVLHTPNSYNKLTK